MSLTGTLWIEREIAADADDAWDLLTDVERWPAWGPSVRAAGLDGGTFGPGATGWVRTPLGVRLRFEITDVAITDAGITDENVGRRWSWKVAGIRATEHRVRPLDGSCVVGFGVPRIAAPYAVVCRRALKTIDRLLTSAPPDPAVS